MGLAGVKQAKDDLERKRRAGGGGGGRNWVKIANGEEIRVRPLEQDEDFTTAYVHSIPVKVQNNTIYRDVPCLDQEGKGRNACPGCEERAKIQDPKKDRRFARRFKFWLNVIWRNGPIYAKETVKGDDGKEYERLKRDDSGNFIEEGRGDVLALWSGGIRAAEELDHANEKFGGLTSRDYTIERDGEGLDTKYRVGPALDENGDTIPRAPLDDADEKIAKEKYDLSVHVDPPSYDDFWDVAGGSSKSAGGDGPSDEETRKSESPFRRRRNAD